MSVTRSVIYSLFVFVLAPLALFVLLDDRESRKAELSHAKRDVAAAEVDAKTLAIIKSVQERLDAMDREKIEMAFSQTTLSGIISTRVYFLEHRIDSLERLKASVEGERGDSPKGE